MDSVWDDESFLTPDSGNIHYANPTRFDIHNDALYECGRRSPELMIVDPNGPVDGTIPTWSPGPAHKITKAVSSGKIQHAMLQQLNVATNEICSFNNDQKIKANSAVKPVKIASTSVNVPNHGVRRLQIRIFSRKDREFQDPAYCSDSKVWESHFLPSRNKYESDFRRCHNRSCCHVSLPTQENHGIAKSNMRSAVTYHHCLLCEKRLKTRATYSKHLQSSSHLQNEKIQLKSLAAMFVALTGSKMPSYNEAAQALRTRTSSRIKTDINKNSNETIEFDHSQHVYHTSPNLIQSLRDAREATNPRKSPIANTVTLLPQMTETKTDEDQACAEYAGGVPAFTATELTTEEWDKEITEFIQWFERNEDSFIQTAVET